MALRRRKLAEFRPLEGGYTRETDTCYLEDEIYYYYPKEKESTLTGQDFEWAEAAIESRKGTFHVYRWGTKFTDHDDYVDIWSHGRLLVSVRRLGHGDGEIMIGTTDIKDILGARNKRENFRGQWNAKERLPFFSGNMTYLGPNECNIELEWIVWLNEYDNHSRTYPSRGEMSEIIVQE